MAKAPKRLRKQAVKKKHQGKDVIPALFIGHNIGLGKYMAAQYVEGGELVWVNGEPLEYSRI